MSSKKKALQVAVRCRPPGRGEGSAVVSADGGSCSVQSGDERAVFSFDRSFGPEESQQAVYDALIAEPMEALFDGYNCTILAYGQTGSGKTHSMLGTPDEPGIIPRFGRELFERASVHEGARVFVSYTQLYNEGFYDLLEPQSGAELKLQRSGRAASTCRGSPSAASSRRRSCSSWWRRRSSTASSPPPTPRRRARTPSSR